jgi:hypothetical protein
MSLSRTAEEFSIGGDQYVLKKIDEKKTLLKFSQRVGKDSCILLRVNSQLEFLK